MVAEGLFDAVKRSASLTESVIVSYSGGKDSAVALDLCSKYFKHVHAFFMYQIPELSFQEQILAWAENKYNIEIYRTPHFELSDFYRAGVFCKPDLEIPRVKVSDVYAHIRSVFNCQWIAAGERAKDSIVRNAMIKKSGSIDVKRGRFFPLAYWSKEHVKRYITANNLAVSPESKFLGHSFRSLDAKDLCLIKDMYPADYERIKSAFPQIDIALAHKEMYAED